MLYLSSGPLIKVQIKKILLHMCDTYVVIIYHTLHFVDFQLNTNFPSQFCIFYLKIT